MLKKVDIYLSNYKMKNINSEGDKMSKRVFNGKYN